MDSDVRTRQVDPRIYRVVPTGEFDMYSSPEFRHGLNTCIEHGADVVIVDLCAASFIDSTFLGTLLGGMKHLRENGGEIRLLCPDSLHRI